MAVQGIVFSVRPPKKSWKNIANLSGGEKTLSSLSLVFALHHYKPTPLYVMDEIDAALGMLPGWSTLHAQRLIVWWSCLSDRARQACIKLTFKCAQAWETKPDKTSICLADLSVPAFNLYVLR